MASKKVDMPHVITQNILKPINNVSDLISFNLLNSKAQPHFLIFL